MLNIKNLVGKKTKSKEDSQIESYKSALEQDPENVNVRLKLGDLYAKAGDKKAAIQEYTTAAVQYANDGYLVKAIAVNKIIVRLDPSRQEALDRLSDLYFQRGVTADPLVQKYREEKEARTKTEMFRMQRKRQEEQEELPTIEPEETELAFEPETVIDLHAEPEQEPDIEVYIQKFPLLANLADETQRWLKRHITIRHFDENKIIVEQEGQQQSLFLIAEGQVRMLTKDKEGQETILDRLEPGGFFGGISLFKPVRQTHEAASGDDDITVVADKPCTIMEIAHDELTALAKREPDVSEALLEEYYKRRASETTLARVPLFSHLDPLERRKISEHLTPENVKKGTAIITEGEVGDCMYLIKVGEVGIYTTLVEDEGVSVIKTDQERLHLATLREGDFFGEQALITKEPRSATVIASTDVQLLKFSKRDLAMVVKQYPRVGTLLKKYHQKRISETLESLKSIW